MRSVRGKLVLFDIDGVLSDDRHRQHLALKERWPEYFAAQAMLADPVWEQGRALVARKLAQRPVEFGYLTGRREDTRPATLSWLGSNGFPTHSRVGRGERLFMKPGGEKIPTPVFKARRLSIFQQHWADIVLYDDDPEVCRVVNEICGEGTAILCEWHIKPAKMIRKAEV